MRTPRRVLMTLDAVGGVWRYATELCRGCTSREIGFVLVGQGPRPTETQRAEVARLGNAELIWLEEPLDWMASGPEEVESLPHRLAELAVRLEADLLHLNLPSQAVGLRALCPQPVVVVSHSCVVTWWDAVKGGPLPEAWEWLRRLNRRGFDAAAAVLAPSRSHALHLERCYGRVPGLQVVANAAAAPALDVEREGFVFAAGRWWDEGKNARTLDAAAQGAVWPVLMAGARANPSGQEVALSHAEWLGVLPHAQVADLVARAGIVVSPSIYEPFGLVALEAARSGAPMVLSDIPTYRELWDGAALFFDPREAGTLRAAIDRLAGSPGMRAGYARAAAARAARFTAEAQAANTLRVWASALARARPPARADVA